MTWREHLTAYKRDLLTERLRAHEGNRSATARELGLTREYLWQLAKDLGVSIPRGKPGPPQTLRPS